MNYRAAGEAAGNEKPMQKPSREHLFACMPVSVLIPIPFPLLIITGLLAKPRVMRNICRNLPGGAHKNSPKFHHNRMYGMVLQRFMNLNVNKILFSYKKNLIDIFAGEAAGTC